MPNPWIEHVKEFSRKHNISYRDALKNPQCKESYHSVNGGSLQGDDLQNLLANSYNEELSDHNDFIVDKELSGRRVQVYHNPQTGQAVTVHRGTQGLKDWGTDLQLALGMKNNKRFKHAEKIQQKANEKYGEQNMTTTGHSLGAYLAEHTGGNSKETITYNKPTTPLDIFNKKKFNKNQFDIRTSKDAVSFLKPFRKNRNDITLKSKSNNLLKEHHTSQLKFLNNKKIGI